MNDDDGLVSFMDCLHGASQKNCISFIVVEHSKVTS